MRKLPLVLLLIASFASVAAAETTGNVAALVGWKWLDDGSWGQVKAQQDYGVSLSIGKRGWPVQIAVDVLRSHRQKDTADPFLPGSRDVFEGDTLELALGVRKFFERKDARPYFGGGIVGVSGQYDQRYAGNPGPSTPIEENAVGVWIGAGVGLRLKHGMSLGLDVRFTEATASREPLVSMPARRPTRSGITLAATSPLSQSRFRLGGLHAGVSLGFHG